MLSAGSAMSGFGDDVLMAQARGRLKQQARVERCRIVASRGQALRRLLEQARAACQTAACLRGQEFGLMFGHQRRHQFFQRRALDDLVELVEGEVDAVVGHPPLREIIGADALGAVAGADLALALGRALGVDPLAFQLVEPRAQELHRRVLVLELGLLGLLGHREPGRDDG